jgi:hypothetical protein
MRHHFRRAKSYVGVCPGCERVRRELRAAPTTFGGSGLGVLEQLKDVDDEYGYRTVQSEDSDYNWSVDATLGSESRMGGLSSITEGSGYRDDVRPSGSSIFYTPTSRTKISGSGGYRDVYCAAHTRGGSGEYTGSAYLADNELEEARRTQRERMRGPKWPAALQKVVVGDVKEGGIAKRRLTVGKGD